MKKIAIVAATLLASGLTHAVTEAEAMNIAQKNGCLACHQLDKKVVGPAWKDVGKKYGDQADAEAMLVTKVKKGSKGVWGPVPMPPNATVKDADVRTLVQFVLTLK